MRKFFRSAICIVMILSLVFALCSCSLEDKKWAVKQGDETIPIGVYIYFLASACSAAQGNVSDSSSPVLNQQIDGKAAQDWIYEEALSYLNYFLAARQIAKERGLTLSDEELAQATSQASSYWSSVKTKMDQYGVAQTSYSMATAQQSALLSKIFKDIYDVGGEKEVTDTDLATYFEENYTYYDYLVRYLYTKDDDGNLAYMTKDEDKTAAKAQLETYLEKYNSGEMTKTDIEKDYKNSEGFKLLAEQDETAQVLTESVSILSEDSDPGKIMIPLDVGKAAIIDYSSSYAYLLAFKGDIKDKTAEWISDSDKRYTLLTGLKNEEFNTFVEEKIKELTDVTYNDKMIGKISLSQFFD